MTDSIVALEMALVATGHLKKEQFPFNQIQKELLDYVNSSKYKELILKEYNKIAKHKHANNDNAI